MLSQAGVVTIVATISPNKEIRENSKDIIGKDNLSLVYLNTPLEICIKSPKPIWKQK